jgi:MATE family multidrug resistance protein
MALAAIVSQLAGAKKYVDISNETYQTGWIALTLGLALIGVYYLLAPSLYNSVTIEADLKDLLFDYLGYIVWGAPGYCLYLVLRNYSEGLSYTKPTMVISIIGLIVNIPANYIFIYGGFGIPALGGAGCGIATAIVYWAMFISMAVYCYKSDYLKKANLFSKFYWPNLSKIKNILMLGVPIALSLLFEVSLFAVVAILLVPFGAEIVASHQIALNFTSLIFMVPLSIAMAITIKVGFAIGDNNFQQAKDYCFHAIIFGLILAILTALITLVFRFQIASIYTSDVGVIELAASLMFLAALYQFSDTVQVISAGALRGYKDTQAILILTFISYWLVGLPVGLILGMTDWIVPRTGPFGFWIGFISGLTIAAVLLAWRLKVIQKRFEDQAIEQQLIND